LGRTTPGSVTGLGQSSWKTVLRKGTWGVGQLLAEHEPAVCPSVPKCPARLMASFLVSEIMLPAGAGKGSSPCTQLWSCLEYCIQTLRLWRMFREEQ